MYGISDIRGSSEERNHAVQKDLLDQYALAIAVIDAVLEQQDIPFLQQLRTPFAKKTPIAHWTKASNAFRC